MENITIKNKVKNPIVTDDSPNYIGTVIKTELYKLDTIDVVIVSVKYRDYIENYTQDYIKHHLLNK
jgi:hypothetical protein